MQTLSIFDANPMPLMRQGQKEPPRRPMKGAIRRENHLFRAGQSVLHASRRWAFASSATAMATTLLDEPNVEDQQMADVTREFVEFINDDNYDYKEEILRLIRTDQTRLIVNLDDLRDLKRHLTDGLLRQPVEYMPAFETALMEVIKLVVDEAKHDIKGKNYRIGLSGSFGENHVSPRTLKAEHLGKMISLEGIITRCSLVRPKMIKSVHYCAETKIFHTREYRDATTSTSNQPPTSSVTPQTDEEGNPLQTEFGLCEFRDHQRISIQEMPERAPAGQLPRSTDIILDDDLVDKCKPGDRIQLVGVYRSIGGGANGAFKFVHVFASLFLF